MNLNKAPSEPEVDALCKALLDMMAQCLEDLSRFVLAEGKTVEQSGPDDLNVRVQVRRVELSITNSPYGTFGSIILSTVHIWCEDTIEIGYINRT